MQRHLSWLRRPVARSPAESILVGRIRAAFPMEGAAGVAAEPASIDWGEVARQARKHALEPLLYAAVRKLPGGEAIPAEVVEGLRAAHERTARKNLAFCGELGSILETLEGEGIAALVLKGGALASTLYPSIGLRPMCDLDILIPADAVSRAGAALEARGYAAVAERAERAGESIDCERAFVRAGGARLPVELHWHVINVVHYRRRTPVEWFWRHSVEMRFHGGRGLVLTPEAQLIHLASHLKLNHHDRRWLREYDIALLMSRFGGQMRWDEVTDAARRFGLGLVVRAALERVESVWGVSAAGAIREELGRQAGLGERIAYAMTSPCLRGLQPLWNAVAAPGWARKVAFLWDYAFPSREYMRRRYGLSETGWAPFPYLRHLGQGLKKIVRPDVRV